jgi:small subunit ribosomal protein S20
MPITKSAIKAMRSSAHKRVVNTHTKDKYKDALKAFRKAITAAKKDEATTAISKATAQLDKAVKKHVIHKNKASRLKSRMAASLKKLSA